MSARRWPAWSSGLLSLGVLLCGCAPALAGPLPDCWDLTIAAIQHRAAAPHPPFILYNETLEIQRDGLPYMRSRASIAYRDDGLVKVEDERFADRPYVAHFAEPGPPELGPYGDRRSAWLPLAEMDYHLPVIGRVRSRAADVSCTNEGLQQYRGHNAYRVMFETKQPEKPSLKALWIDVQSDEIWKVILSAYIPVTGLNSDQTQLRMTDFQVELERQGAYLVVDHVTWKYRLREYTQYSEFFGEYYYSSFQFPRALPAGYFST